MYLQNQTPKMELPANFIHKVDIVAYHEKCSDGVGGAWPFWRENIERYRKGDVTFEGFNHGHPPPNVENKLVAIVDFCFPRKTIIEMASKAKFILILDHHVSAKREIEGLDLPNVKTIFDMKRSAAQIAWDFVYPDYKCPWFVNIIAERDLWKWSSDESKEISNALYRKGYYSWEKLEGLLAKSQTQKQIDDIIKGLLEISKQNKIPEKEIEAVCKSSILTEMTTPDGKVYKVRLASCLSKKIRSEVGNRLSEDCDFAITWQYDFFLDEWWCSARASEKSKVDVSAIATQFLRGGGHKKAAGFTIKSGESLRTYFKAIEVPFNREQDAKSIGM